MASSKPNTKLGKTQLPLKGEPGWISHAVVNAIHADLIQQHGGLHGIRDVALLESALDRPKNRYDYEPDADLATLAASYAIGIARNHAFIDGNKRTAFQVMYVFLGLNRYRIVATEAAVVALMIDVATGAVDENSLAQWCRANVVAW